MFSGKHLDTAKIKRLLLLFETFLDYYRLLLTQPANKTKPKPKKQPKTNCPISATNRFSSIRQQKRTIHLLQNKATRTPRPKHSAASYDIS
jgi:hypothetical protein